MCAVLSVVDRHTHQAGGSELSRRTISLWLVALVVTSLLLQSAYSHLINPYNRQLSAPSNPEQTLEESRFLPQSDEIDYYRIALNLLNRRGYSLSGIDQASEPTAYRPPLFPVLLAAVFRVGGPWPELGVWVNQVLIALLIPLSFWIGRLLSGDRCGVIAAIIVTLWPHGFYFGSNLLTEPLFAVLVTVAFGLLVRLASSPSWGGAAAAGLAAGGAALARSGFVPTLVLLGLWFLLLSRRQMPWRIVLVFWATVALTLAPWSVRNYAVMDMLSPGTTGSGSVFAGAHNSQTLTDCPGGWTKPQVPVLDVDRVAQMSEVEQDTYLWGMGYNFLTQQPPRILLKLFAFKVLRLWAPVQRIVSDKVCTPCNVLTSFLFLFPVLLSVLGLWLLRSHKAIFWLGLLFLGGATLMTMIFWGGTRFRMPLEPILWTLAAYAAVRLVEDQAVSQVLGRMIRFSLHPEK